MSNIDQVALDIIDNWMIASLVDNPTQTIAKLQIAIVSAFKEQQKQINVLRSTNKLLDEMVDKKEAEIAELQEKFNQTEKYCVRYERVAAELQERLRLADEVIEAADNMICMYDVASGVEVAKTRILLEKTLKDYNNQK